MYIKDFNGFINENIENSAETIEHLIYMPDFLNHFFDKIEPCDIAYLMMYGFIKIYDNKTYDVHYNKAVGIESVSGELADIEENEELSGELALMLVDPEGRNIKEGEPHIAGQDLYTHMAHKETAILYIKGTIDYEPGRISRSATHWEPAEYDDPVTHDVRTDNLKSIFFDGSEISLAVPSEFSYTKKDLDNFATICFSEVAQAEESKMLTSKLKIFKDKFSVLPSDIINRINLLIEKHHEDFTKLLIHLAQHRMIEWSFAKKYLSDKEIEDNATDIGFSEFGI